MSATELNIGEVLQRYRQIRELFEEYEKAQATKSDDWDPVNKQVTLKDKKYEISYTFKSKRYLEEALTRPIEHLLSPLEVTEPTSSEVLHIIYAGLISQNVSVEELQKILPVKDEDLQQLFDRVVYVIIHELDLHQSWLNILAYQIDTVEEWANGIGEKVDDTKK